MNPFQVFTRRRALSTPVSLVFSLACLAAAPMAHAGHVYAGIIDTNGTPGLQNGDALSFINTTVTSPTYGGSLTGNSIGSFTTTGTVTNPASPQFGLYLNSSVTFTALSRGKAIDGSAYVNNANPFASSASSFLTLELVGVTGPNGAHVSFWDTGATSATFTFTIGTGITTGTGRFNLTDSTSIIGDGTTALPVGTYTYANYGYSPNPAGTNTAPNGLPSGFTWNDADGLGGSAVTQDPFGHIHGRSITFDAEGQYTLSFVIHDSTGQQADSAQFTANYNIVPEPGALTALVAGGGLLAFRRFRPRALLSFLFA